MIELVQKLQFHKKTKHIDVLYHLVREFQSCKEITLFYVPTRLELVDILTKALTLDIFKKLKDALNLS